MREQSAVAGYVASESFVFRTPLLPVDAFTACICPPSRDAVALDDWYAATVERLWTILDRGCVSAALHAASPHASDAIVREQGRPASERRRKVARTALRYLSRMTSRATPLGLLAGTSVGRFGPATHLELAPAACYARRTRISAAWLLDSCSALIADPDTRKTLEFVRNPTAYRSPTGWRFVKTCYSTAPFEHWLMQCVLQPPFDEFVSGAGRPAPYAVLADRLSAAAPKLDDADIGSAMSTLIMAQLLVPDLWPSLTSGDMAAALKADLDANPSTVALARTVESMEEQCAAWDARGLASMDTPVGDARSAAWQHERYRVDLWKPSPTATLSTELVDDIRRGVEILWRLHGQPEREDLARFRTAFAARYNAAEVPLLTALDEEDGVGFGDAAAGTYSCLLDRLPFDHPARESKGRAVVKQRLLERLSEALADRSEEIALSDGDADAMEAADRASLPAAFQAMVSVAVDAGQQPRVWLRNVIGPSGVRYIARFCHVDPSIESLVRAHVREEEDGVTDAVLAEVVHVSDGHTANIASRPVLRTYEIPCGARSGAPADHQLDLSDLYVSVANDFIRVRSATLDRFVIPRMSNAHYYARGVPAYRFLCALQAQHAAEYITWRWDALTPAPRLPRVVMGRLVLCRAQWRLTESTIERIGTGDLASACAAVREWRAVSAVPQLALFVDGDEELLLDLENPVCVDVLRDLLRGRASATFAELWPPPDQLAAFGPDGRFVHEIIVPFVRRRSAQSASAVDRHDVTRSRTRRFAPGSRWCYAKIYVSDAAADTVLRGAISAAVDAAITRGLTDRWHFLRYCDPERHIRLRLRAAPGGDWHDLAREITRAMDDSLERSIVRDLHFAGYAPEVHRYGGEAGLDAAEQVFRADSDAALDIVRLTESDADARWWLLLRSWDVLLADFGLDDGERLALACRMRTNVARHLSVTKPLKVALGEKFRAHRADIAAVLARPMAAVDWRTGGAASIARRSAALAPLVKQLRDDERAGVLVRPVDEILLSLLHMSANRVLRRSDAKQDFALADMLSRVYDERLARLSHARARDRRRDRK